MLRFQLSATPLVSRATLRRNAQLSAGVVTGLIITPAHNPPEDGGMKYNTSDGDRLIVMSPLGLRRMPISIYMIVVLRVALSPITPQICDLRHIIANLKSIF